MELKFAKSPQEVTVSLIDANASNITQTEAVILWNTSKELVGNIVYGTDSTVCTQQETGSCLTASEDTASTSHEITLTNLIPNTSYYYYLDNNTRDTKNFTTKSQDLVIPPADNKIEGDTNGDGILNSLDFSVN